VIGFRLAGWPIRGRPDRLGGLTIDVCHGIAHAAGEQAVRLGAEELRPAWADPPRRRAEARSAQHGRDRAGRDGDPEHEQLALDAHIAPARVLPRQPFDQPACPDRKRGTTGPTTAARIGWPEKGIVYPRSELALRHGAGVEAETTSPAEAYAPFPKWQPGPPESWAGLPWAVSSGG
jgi:hypothetical protein